MGLESICGLALNLGRVRFAEWVTVPAQRAGCVKASDGNAVLMRTAPGFCPLGSAADAPAGVSELLWEY